MVEIDLRLVLVVRMGLADTADNQQVVLAGNLEKFVVEVEEEEGSCKEQPWWRRVSRLLRGDALGAGIPWRSVQICFGLR